MSYTTATLTGSYKTWSGGPAAGTVEIIPNSPVLIDAEGDVILSGRVKATLDASGSFSVTLPATDDATVEPATGRQYTVVAKLRHQHLKAVTGVELAGGETVDMADVTSATETAPITSTWLTEADYLAVVDRVAALEEAGPGGGGAVESVNGETGVVTLTAADVGAVVSVNGETGTVTLSASDVGAVQSVNGEGGVVSLSAADVGADPAGSAAAAQTAAIDAAVAQIAARTLRAVKATNTTVSNSITTVDDGELVVPLAANTTYELQGYLRYESSTTADFRAGLTVPIDTTATWTGQGGSTTVATNGIGTGWWQDRDATQTVLLGGAGAGVPLACQIVGTVVTGANAGDLKIRWAQNTAEVSDTKLLAGSRLRVTHF